MFKVGGKVLCVNASGIVNSAGEVIPVQGKVYTVREMDEEGIWLKEIINRPMFYLEGLIECNFKYFRFIPLSDIQTELSSTTVEEFLSETVEA